MFYNNTSIWACTGMMVYVYLYMLKLSVNEREEKAIKWAVAQPKDTGDLINLLLAAYLK